MPNSSIISFKKYLFWFFGLYFLGLGIFFSVTEWMILKYVEPYDNIQGNLELMARPDIRNIAVGDSHVALGFNSVDDFFTVAYPGENLVDTRARLNFLLKGNKLKRVILQADPHMFSNQRLHDSHKSYLKNLADWRGTAKGSGTGVLRTLEPYHRAKLLLYWKTFLFGTFQDSALKIHPNGWIKMDKNWSEIPKAQRKERALKGMQTQIPSPGGVQYRVFQNLLLETIEELVLKNIEACLVTFPVAGEYFELAKSRPEFLKEIENFRLLAQAEGIPYFNGFGIYAEEKYSSFFVNEDHLGEKGALHFSKQIIEACFNRS